MSDPTTPIQPLPPKFFTSTLIAFLRFLLLHPLYVGLSLVLQFGLLSAFRTFASTALLEVATPLVVMLVELSTILFLAPLAFSFLQTQKSTETASSAQAVGAAVSSFVRNEAWTSGSVLGWKLWLFALGVGSLTGAFFFSASDSGSPTEPTGIFWVMQTSGLAALLLPLHLTVGLGSFLIALDILPALGSVPLQGKPSARHTKGRRFPEFTSWAFWLNDLLFSPRGPCSGSPQTPTACPAARIFSAALRSRSKMSPQLAQW